MEYPGTKFTKKWRLALLISIILTFLILSPIVILYSMGYRYDWQYGILHQGGALSVDIQPKIGEVYLDTVKLDKNLINKKVEIKNIRPKKYDLVIKTPNYYDWKKEIDIKNGKTVYIKEINLIKKNEPELLSDKSIKKISLSRDNNVLLYIDKDNNIYLKQFNNNSEAQRISTVSSAQDTLIKWGDKNNCAYTYILKDGIYSNIQVICPYANPVLFRLNNTKNINKMQWSNDVTPILYYSDSKNIYSYNASTKREQTISKNKFLDWYLYGNSLWTLSSNTTTKAIAIIENTLGFNKKYTTVYVKDKKELKIGKNKWQIIEIRDNNILLKRKGLQNMLLLNGNKQHRMTASNYRISQYNNWWLFWSEWELWTYANNSEPSLVNRSGQHLQDVVSLDQYNTLGLVWKDSLSALYPYYLVEINLQQNIEMNEMAVDSTNRIMYYTIKNKNGIWKLNY